MASEVKGLWFVVARRYLVDHHGIEVVQQMADAIEAPYRQSLLDPMRSGWYPEACLQQYLRAYSEIIARRDEKRMLAAIEDCTLQGVNRFFEVLLRLTTPRFVMRQTPVLWRYVRRGQGMLAVEADDERAICRYIDFPYFEDVNYRLLALGTLRPMAALCGGTNPRAEVLDYGKDFLDVEVRYRASVRPTSSAPPPA
jgi:hypothetical protein